MANVIPIYLPEGSGPFSALRRLRTSDRLLSLVNEKDFASNFTIMVANVTGAPTALVVPVSTVVGRNASGNIASLTATEVRTLLNVTDGAQPLAGTQLGTGADVFKDIVADAMRFRSIVTGDATYLTVTENTDDITLDVVPGAFTIVDAGDTTGSPSVGDVPEWDGAQFTFEPNGSGGGLSDVVDDTTPQLGGDLDVNSNSIVSGAGTDIAIAPASGRDVLITTAAGGALKVNGDEALPVNTGTPTQGDMIIRDATEYTALSLGTNTKRLTSDGTDIKWATDTRYMDSGPISSPTVRTYHLGLVFQNSTAVRVYHFVRGTTPSVTFRIMRGPDKLLAGTEVLSSTVSSGGAPGPPFGTQGRIIATGLTATMDSSDFFWIDVTAVSGTVDEFGVGLIYNENP